MATPEIQWYPGHIAKAEKALLEQLKRVDVVLEVRDARIPQASCHPEISNWVGSKARVLVINRVDQVTPQAVAAWRLWLQARGKDPIFTDAQHGKGVAEVMRAAQQVGIQINQRRRDRGMRPRPVRAVVIGFPNVGKSALINRLLKRRIVDSARRPGVTRSLRWVRISDQLDLLDAPGVLPAKLLDQAAAYRLAICDDIGEASYDTQLAAAALVETLQKLPDYNAQVAGFGPPNPLNARYHLDAKDCSGETYVATLATARYQRDRERAARQLLSDFRKGLLGSIALEMPSE
ncbi:ribosome biogenesis GTPase YlqF [Synechococcales cyanobacterium C]|uniref:Ribosome biogenesis GTPase A n=1 Tax=Petrachloros mirabilis ULC683 TaxID=2781853 RepID=A0A8K1ZXY5_9CYAN|nr:ribosome biogenesis GTPase YlqF [Petrachloros mirabilis]NCJ06151.1 ribosome biogenesis GTPase YlqF [Petrachloros mirabilis ULC683]